CARVTWWFPRQVPAPPTSGRCARPWPTPPAPSCCASSVAAARATWSWSDRPYPRRRTTMSPTHTENLKTNLSEAGSHLKHAAGEEMRVGGANLKADLADGAIAGLSALEEAAGAGSEQVDQLLEKGRDLVDSAADLIRERPIASFGVAFAAGWIIAKLARGSDK